VEDGARHRAAQAQVNVVAGEKVKAEESTLARNGQIHDYGLQRTAHEPAW
jgi:hypothetical protein